MKRDAIRRVAGRLIHRFLVLFGAVAFTFAFFLVLPLMQKISERPTESLTVRAIDSARPEPPPPTPEEPPDDEEEPEEEPQPELKQSNELLDLDKLELAIGGSGLGEGWLAGDFEVNLGASAASDSELGGLYSLSELDQPPRVVYQVGPNMTPQIRKRTPGQVVVIFIVDASGRVVSPKVQQSTDPALERAALAAIKQWRFEPGKRKGEPVRFRMRQPITFPKVQ